MSNLKVGYSRVNANPPLGYEISGYYIKRYAKGYLDDITVGTLLLQLGDTKIAMISVDVCGINSDFGIEVSEMIEKATGISKDNIYLTATHSHTGPVIVSDPDKYKDNDEKVAYIKFLKQRIVDSVVLALNDVKDAKMGYIYGYAPERVAFIRRYMMKDGTTFTCPPIDDPNIDYALGTLDQRVNVLRFDRKDAPTIVAVNYGLHADTINGELVSADFPSVMAKTLEKALDGVKCIFFNGAEGDVGSTNVHPTKGDMNDTEISFDNEMKSPGMARFVGRALAGTVLQVYDKVHYVDVDEIKIASKYIDIPSNMPTPEEMPLARLYKQLHEEGKDDQIPYKAMQLTTAVADAIRKCRLENGPEFFRIRLTAVKIGPVVYLGIPGEPFTDIGVEIKKAEGWNLIMPTALTNGNIGYFPMKSAYDEGGYEAKTSNFKAGVAEIIIENAIQLLNEIR